MITGEACPDRSAKACGPWSAHPGGGRPIAFRGPWQARPSLDGWALPALVLLVFTLAGCKPAPRPSATPLPAGPVRVVSLTPSLTEIICAIGAGDELVGRSTACDYPPDIVARVPVVGEFGVPSLERVLATKPDIVLFGDIADESMVRKLDRVGLRQARIRCTRLDDLPSAIAAVGKCVHREAQADALAADLQRRIQAVRSKAVPLDQQPRVLVLIWNDPLTAAGRNGFLSDLVALAGGRNVGDTVDRDYFQVSSEWVIAQDPDIIFCFFMANGNSVRQTILGQAGWAGVKAVKTGRVYDGFDNNLVLRPGPRLLEGLESIRHCIDRPPAP